jgi:hypothetical protein
VVFEQRYTWGRAYRDGQLVCARVHVTVGRDGRLGLTPYESRYVVARFSERLHPELRAELTELARRRGASTLCASWKAERSPTAARFTRRPRVASYRRSL